MCLELELKTREIQMKSGDVMGNRLRGLSSGPDGEGKGGAGLGNN